MHLLIPYIHFVDHADPDFSEFTYGDVNTRARKLKNDLQAGDFVFFHTTVNNKKWITSYYVVDRVLDTKIACQDETIINKYRNPHLIECLNGKRAVRGDDVVLFGDPIRSIVFEKPLLFDRNLADKLSIGITFNNKRSDTQNISSATRSWRQLTDGDIKTLFDAFKANQNKSCLKLHRSTEEVSQTLERDIESHFAESPNDIGSKLKLVGRQLPVPSGRIDLLLENENGNKTVVEIKLGRIGRDALNQIKKYMRDLKENHKVSGVIICEGVLPAYEEELRKQRDIRIMIYGWNLGLQQWK